MVENPIPGTRGGPVTLVNVTGHPVAVFPSIDDAREFCADARRKEQDRLLLPLGRLRVLDIQNSRLVHEDAASGVEYNGALAI